MIKVDTKKKIFIIQQRGWAINIGKSLAYKFKNLGYKIGTVTFKKTTHKLIQKRSEQYEFIINHDAILENPHKYLDNTDITLGEICDELGVESIWPLVQSLRNHVKSYKKKYYYGFSQNVKDEEIIIYIKAIHKLIRKIIDEFNPSIIISPNFVGYFHISLNLYCQKKNIPMIGITDTKVEGLLTFTNNYLETTGEFVNILKNLNFKNGSLDKAETFINKEREKLNRTFAYGFARPKSLISNLKELIKRVTIGLIKRNYNYTLGPTTDNAGVFYAFRDFYFKYYNSYKNKRIKYYDIEKIDKIIFCPLKFQPEASIDVIAWAFNNQIETIRQIAMRLPDDYTLVVKDHPAMNSFRSPSYLKKIYNTANVKLISPNTKIDVIFERSDIIIGTSCTMFFEAAIYGKKVIQLNDSAFTKYLPNVEIVENLNTLTTKIKNLLETKLDISSHNYHSVLVQYIAAAYSIGFNENYIGVWERNEKSNEEKIFEIFKEELDRLTNNTND